MVPKFWNSFYGAPLMAAFGVGCWAPRVGGACSFRVCGSAGGAFGGLGLGVFGIVGLLLGVGLWCFRWLGIEWLVWVLMAFPGAGDSVICAELPMRSRFFQNFFLFPSEKHFFFFFGMWAKALLMARVRELDVPCF